jgi:hypothetical protein
VTDGACAPAITERPMASIASTFRTERVMSLYTTDSRGISLMRFSPSRHLHLVRAQAAFLGPVISERPPPTRCRGESVRPSPAPSTPSRRGPSSC